MIRRLLHQLKGPRKWVGFTQKVIPVAPWNPSKLTGLIEAWPIAILRAAGKLWQDLAMTIPAVANGDPVAVAVGQFNEVPLVALNYPSTDTRPRLVNEGSGYWSIACSEAQPTQMYFQPPSAVAQPFSIGIAIESGYNVNDGNSVLYRSQSAQAVGYRNTGTSYTLYAGNLFDSSAAYQSSGICARIDVYNGASSQIISNGTVYTGNAGSEPLNESDSDPVNVFTNEAGTAGATGHFSGLVVSTDINSADLVNLAAYLSSLISTNPP